MSQRGLWRAMSKAMDAKTPSYREQLYLNRCREIAEENIRDQGKFRWVREHATGLSRWDDAWLNHCLKMTEKGKPLAAYERRRLAKIYRDHCPKP